MLKIGLTGNIGSGKTTVCRIFEILGVPVFYADVEAKKILEEPSIIARVASFLGQDIIDKNGMPDRSRIASKVFNNKDLLDKLNNTIHPELAEKYNEWLAKHKEFPYTIKEAAILFESGYYKDVDKIIVIVSDNELMIDRVVKRDKVSRKAVEERINNQMSQNEKMSKADFIIKNYEENMLIPQVLEIHKRLSG